MPIRIVTFNFTPEVSPERQGDVLAAINSWPGVSSADNIKPGAKRADLRLMAYAYLAEDANAAEVVKSLTELDEVDAQSVSVAPPRRLV
ncbi:MAG TPA: hypothetical protein VF656_19000 [Pyrinomonadaceae bacterium]